MADEQLKHDLEPLVRGSNEGRQEWRQQEPSADGEPLIHEGTRPDLDSEPMGLVPSQEEVDARSELARWLKPQVFPAGRNEILTSLDAATPPDVVDAIRALPDDRQYPTVQSIWSALGHPVEGSHTGRRQDGEMGAI